MVSFAERQPLIELLHHGRAQVRMAALHLLSESYTDSPEIYQAIVAGWKRWGIGSAFGEIPMLSYLPIPPEQIEDCCWRARQMATGQALTSPQSRAAGKLLEQLVALPPETLAPHLEEIEEAKRASKIFFRVDTDKLRLRIEFLQYNADQLARILDHAIGVLAQHRESLEAFRRATAALESIRRRFPDYIDLRSVLDQGKGSTPHQEVSLMITLQSLIHDPQPGLAEALGNLLDEEDEGVVSTVTEALVRDADVQAARVLCGRYRSSRETTCQWIARGLQRKIFSGVADEIYELRCKESEPHLWLMLLIAEIRQFDVLSASRIATDLDRLLSPSEILIDSLRIYLSMHEDRDNEAMRDLEESFTAYLQRIDRNLSSRIQRRL